MRVANARCFRDLWRKRQNGPAIESDAPVIATLFRYLPTTTYDRHLLRRFLGVFLIAFFATFGLFVVIDGFTNVDEFQERSNDGSVWTVLMRMAMYYACQSTLFLDLGGPTLTVVSVMVVLGLLQRNGEIQPILSAGVPTYRLAAPLVAGTLIVNVAMMVNQELVIPRISQSLQLPRGMDESQAQTVDPVRDFATDIHIGGKELFVNEQKMRDAEFVLPPRKITHELTVLHASEAQFRPPIGDRPSGWLLKGVSPTFDEILLTDKGEKTVLEESNRDDLFVVTDVSFDQLYNRSTSHRFMSTTELLRRIKNPAFGTVWVRSQTLLLHQRLTYPLTSVIAIILSVPLMFRKESGSIVANAALCGCVLGFIFGLTQLAVYLSKADWIAPDLAVWMPIIASGTLSVWLSDWVQT